MSIWGRFQLRHKHLVDAHCTEIVEGLKYWLYYLCFSCVKKLEPAEDICVFICLWILYNCFISCIILCTYICCWQKWFKNWSPFCSWSPAHNPRQDGLLTCCCSSWVWSFSWWSWWILGSQWFWNNGRVQVRLESLWRWDFQTLILVWAAVTTIVAKIVGTIGPSPLVQCWDIKLLVWWGDPIFYGGKGSYYVILL